MLIFYFLVVFTLCNLLPSGIISLSFTPSCLLLFSCDLHSQIFSKILVIISISVLLWSYYYLGSEVVYIRFYFLLLSFLFSIFILIFATNLISLLIGWDLLGFTSFFLVAYYGSASSHRSAILTGLSNRLGDCFFFILLAHCLSEASSISSSALLLIVLVAITKSAQLPFCSWLPAAIFAPTPVSALVHSSTLVTAGIYLLIRFDCFLSDSLLILGVLTSLTGGFAACVEQDIKKIIAYSTLSQLGILMSGLGIGQRTLTFNHLLSHAVIKALIFMCVGILIHTYYGSQEARSCAHLPFMGSLTNITFAVSSLALAGLSFTSGSLTKEALLEAGYCSILRALHLLLFYISIGLRVAYLFRLALRLFNSRTSTNCFVSVVGTSPINTFAMLILIFTILYHSIRFSTSDSFYVNFLRARDKLMVHMFIACGFVIGFCLMRNEVKLVSPLSYLNFTVCRLGSSYRLQSQASCLEVCSLQSLGIGYWQGILRSLSIKTPLTSIRFFLTVLVCVLC